MQISIVNHSNGQSVAMDGGRIQATLLKSVPRHARVRERLCGDVERPADKANHVEVETPHPQAKTSRLK